METKDLNVLVKALQCKSLTKASMELGYSSSAGSHIIDRLEAQLGVTLLERSHTGVSPTPDCSALLPYIHTILQQQATLEKVANKLGTKMSAQLNVGCISSVAISWLPQIIDSFHEKFPWININIFDGTYEEMERWLQDGTVDCGFLTSGTRCAFSLWPLRSDPFYVVMPKGHPLSEKESIHPLELQGYHILVPSEGMSYDAGKVIKMIAQSNSHIASARWSDYSVLSMVRQGRGITLLPELLIRNVGLEGIEARPLSTGEKRTVCLAVNNPDGEAPGPVVKQFIDHVVDWATKR